MPIPGQSNFYFNPIDQNLYQKGVNIFGALPGGQQTPQVSPTENRSVEEILSSALGGATKADLEAREQKSQSLLGTVKDAIKSSLLRSAIPGLLSPGGTF